MIQRLEYAGLGATTADTAVQLGTVAAQAVVPVAIGSTVAATLGIATTVAIPLVGAVIAGISVAIEAILHSGCGQTCIVTSQWANQAEQQLQQNISEYFAIPAPRPQSVQQIAMANFKAIWNTLVQQCSQPNLGAAGRNCIADRQDGACKLRQNVPPAYPGIPAIGQCWNWWSGYYWPIANDPDVQPDNILNQAGGGAGGVVSRLCSCGSDSTLLLMGGALLLGAVALVMS